MQKFLLRISLFILPIIAVSFFLDNRITNGIRKAYGGNAQVWDDVIEGKLLSDIWVLGSSRALNHMDPAILQDTLLLPTYNMGMSGQDFMMINARYHVALKYNKAPQLIILNVDLNTLRKNKELYAYNSFSPVLNEPIVREAAHKYQGFDFFDYNLPLVRYIGSTDEIKCCINYWLRGKKSSINYYRGYTPHLEGWNGDFERVKQSMSKFRADVDSPTIALLESVIKEISSHNIKLVMVYTPEYKEAADFVENRADLVKVYTQFSDKYNVPFLNYSNDSLCYSKDYFFNALHLNKKGATIFSKHLASDIKRLNILPTKS